MVLGITGGVGCGKSTVMSLLEREYQAKLIIADEIGHRAMERGTGAWEEIRQQFGDGVLTEEGEVDRGKLAAIVYRDDAKRELLNGIIHPYVYQEIGKKLAEWEGEPLVVLETAILFETGCDVLCDEIWWVDAGRETRVRRLMDSRGYSRGKAEAIMDKQMSEDEWRRRTDHRIDNNGNCEKLTLQVKDLLAKF